jgi:hypothetical protein
MVPLNRPLTVTKLSFLGVDNTSLPLKENGTITAKNFKEAMTIFFDNDEDPEIGKTIHVEPDEETQILPFVVILENGQNVMYRAPLIMAYFLLDIATGVIINNSRLRRQPNLRSYVPFEMTFFATQCQTIIRGDVGKLLEMCNDLGDNTIPLTRD